MKLEALRDLKLKCEHQGNMTHDPMASGETVLAEVQQKITAAKLHEILGSPIYSVPSGKYYLLELQVVPVAIKEAEMDEIIAESEAQESPLYSNDE